MLCLAAAYCALLPVMALAWFAPTPRWLPGVPKLAIVVLMFGFFVLAFGIVRRLMWRGAIEIEADDAGLHVHSWVSNADIPWSAVHGLALFPARVLRVKRELPRPSSFQLRCYGGRLRWAIGGTALAVVYEDDDERLRYWVLPHPAFVADVKPVTDLLLAHLSAGDARG